MRVRSACLRPLPGVLLLAVGLGCAGGGRSDGTPAVAPTIVAAPSSQDVLEGAPVAFSVAAGGSAPLSYQWERNGVGIPGATGAALELETATAAEDGAIFTVRVSNPAGEARSAGALLRVLTPQAPSLAAQPEDESVGVGGTATFTATATGRPAPTFQWCRDGAPIAGATDPAYTTPATTPADDGATFTVRVSNQAGTLTSAPARLRVQAATQGPNLSLERLYLTQGIQSSDGKVPLVAGREAFLRVFVKADRAGLIAPVVRVTLLNAGSVVAVRDLSATEATVPTTLDEGDLGASWNLPVSGSLMQPGLSVLAEVDPDHALSESDRADNLWPRSGKPQALDVRLAPILRATVVPVEQSGLTGNATAANLESYFAWARKLYPLKEVDASLGATFTTSTVVDNAGHGMSQLLSEIEAKRVAEGHGEDRFYYGVYRLPNYDTYASSGLAYIAKASSTDQRSAIGHDLEGAPLGRNYPEVFAHELGHDFGRHHTPGCGAEDTDGSYPYGQDGHIGAYGLDLESLEVQRPEEATDLMNYCTGHFWVSDYVYRRVMDFRASSPMGLAGPQAPPAQEDCLLVWGRRHAGVWTLEPGFVVRTLPHLGRAGDSVLRLEGEGGRSLMDLAVEPAEVADGPEGEAHLVLAIPLRVLGGQALRGITLLEEGREVASLRSDAHAAPLRAGGAGPACRFDGEGRAHLAWTSGTMALVRDADTGEVLAFLRGGAGECHTSARRLEVQVSDGVSSRAWTFER